MARLQGVDQGELSNFVTTSAKIHVAGSGIYKLRIPEVGHEADETQRNGRAERDDDADAHGVSGIDPDKGPRPLSPDIKTGGTFRLAG